MRQGHVLRLWHACGPGAWRRASLGALLLPLTGGTRAYSERVDNHVENIDPLILDSVHAVRDRFGPDGLRALIAEAEAEIAQAESAMDKLESSPE